MPPNAGLAPDEMPSRVPFDVRNYAGAELVQDPATTGARRRPLDEPLQALARPADGCEQRGAARFRSHPLAVSLEKIVRRRLCWLTTCS